MRNKNSDSYDKNISTKYGTAFLTRDNLNQELITQFMNHDLIKTYGKIQNFRIPFKKQNNTSYYFGDLTMTNMYIHDELIE